MHPRLTIAVLSAAVALVAAGCSSSTPAAAGSSPIAASEARKVTQTSDGGQVTVEVEWAGPSAGAEFHVTMDTHAVDLDPLDLGDATLRNDRGETMTARPWAAPKGGHHRRGFLSFDGDAQAFLADAEWIELVIVGVGDLPERTLRWEVGS
jgi:hypothetical protein